MALATERIPVLMTPKEKRVLVSRARKAGLSNAEFLRRAARVYQPADDEKALVAMIDEMNKATNRTELTIDRVLSYVAASNKRIGKMESKIKTRMA